MGIGHRDPSYPAWSDHFVTFNLYSDESSSLHNCPTATFNFGSHPSVLGIAAFNRDFDNNNDHSDVTMFCAFVSSYDANGVKISVRDHKMRGRAIMDLQKLWISLWDAE